MSIEGRSSRGPLAAPAAPVAGPVPVTTVVAVTLGLAAASWGVAVRGMAGMDMGVATRLGSFGSFLLLWVAMMAAMMLPGAVPAAVRGVRAGRRLRATTVFVGSYLAVWALVGIALYGVYRPHGTVAAGAVVIAAGIYELTPLKAHFRRRCREGIGVGAGAGVRFGLCCVGSSIGLMLALLAVGAMSLTWMSVAAVVLLAQKLLPPHAGIDLPVATAIVGVGVLAVVAPGVVPALTPSM